MSFLPKKKKLKGEEVETAVEKLDDVGEDTTPEEKPAAKPAPAKKAAGKRALVSLHPSERRAWISVDGVETRVTYDADRQGVARIGLLAGEPSIKLDDWLAGEVELKGLQVR